MVKCDAPLNFCFHLQYACCLKYDIRRDRTAHLFTHQINVEYKELRTAIYEFALDNTTWIEKVGSDALGRANLTVEDFLKGLRNGTIVFDELCILITCRTFNVHCVVLLDGAYWSTRPNNALHDCLIKIAYVGDYGFKEVQTEVYDSFNEPDGSCSDDDLQGTGLNVDGVTSKEACDSENTEQQSPKGSTKEDTLDVKPLVRHLVTFTSTANDAIVISDDEQEPQDVKPLIKAHVKITIDASDAIVISDDETLQPNQPVPPLPTVPLPVPRTVKYHRIKRDRNYSCHLCDQTFEMQSAFVSHFRDQHPNDLLKCDFCASTFESSNGLFKHERSHLYMKYKCDACGRLFQFPYQLNIHSVQHTGLGRHQCTQCTRTFGSKCSRVFHERSHNVQIKCDLCPMSSTKIYNNQVAVNQHKRGMHGPGWTTTCGINYKWKSRYQRHNKSDCKKCIQNKAQRKLDRFSFLRKMDLTQEAE